MKTRKKLLLIAATHGNERIGVQVIQYLIKKGYGRYFDYMIANPKALKLKRRFIDVDLNRSYPGDVNSQLYEKVLAAKNFKIAKKYHFVIDIHEASSGTDSFIISPTNKIPKLFPISLVDLKKILLWPYPKGPLCQFIENGIELEFGMKKRNRIRIVNEANMIIEKFIKRLNSKQSIGPYRKEVFVVYGKLLNDNTVNIDKLRDFKITRRGRQKFYPLLTGQYLNEGIACYKMRRKTISL